jgi:nucleoside phosphorylase
MTLHHEIKALKANLIRNDFTRYTNSKEFTLVLMENDFDDHWKHFIVKGYGLDPEQKLNAFINMLNVLLLQWINANPQSSESLTTQSYINNLVKKIIESFIDWSKELNDSSKIIQSIKNIGPITDNTLEEIEQHLKTKRSKSTIKETQFQKATSESLNVNSTNIDYAIITALEEDEMEKILQLFEKESEVGDTNNYIEFGHLKTNPSKKVVYASQHNTGMVDASILATEILVRFKPKYLIMTGVLGGRPEETNIGDVIIATKVFEIDRGKITDTGFKKESSVSSITSKEIKKVHRSKKEIEKFIDSQDETRNSNVKLHFGPIASVNQVIDIEGFFESKITEIDRKAIALEMESFAIVRSCELVNEGKTIPIIIKSVMDNTQNKADNAKSYASWTSARTLEYILKNEII